MHLHIMLSAFIAGLIASLIWMGLHGIGVDAIVVYVLAGHMMIAALLLGSVLRRPLR